MNKIHFAYLFSTFLLICSCKSNEPCESYFRFYIAKHSKNVWICAVDNHQYKVLSEILQDKTITADGEKKIIIDSIGKIALPEFDLEIDINDNDVYLNKMPMKKNINAAVGTDNTIVMGAFIRDFD